MAKKRKATAVELDSIYLFKMLLYLILGSFWLRISTKTLSIPLPLGLAVGIFLASRERFQIDRKIEYAILLLAMFIGFWLPSMVTLVIK